MRPAVSLAEWSGGRKDGEMCESVPPVLVAANLESIASRGCLVDGAGTRMVEVSAEIFAPFESPTSSPYAMNGEVS